MSFKASDLLLTITDLFVILLPGFFLIVLLAVVFEWWKERQIKDRWEEAGAGKWVVVLAVSLLLGHFTSQFGAWREDWYWKTNRTSIEDEHPELRVEAVQLARKVYHLVNVTERNIRGWSALLVRVQDSKIGDRIDRRNAERRFFRNMIIVFLFTAGAAVVRGAIASTAKRPRRSRSRRSWILLVIFSVALVFSTARYFYQTDKYTKEVLETFIALTKVGERS